MRTLIRRWFARFLGFQDEIDNLSTQVANLSWDEPFGMWTRNAFLSICLELPVTVRPLVFIDLNNISSLNLKIGYDEVDRRIRESFSGLTRNGHTVARWYSGDEVVILFSHPLDPIPLVESLADTARQHGLSFAYSAGVWDSSKETIQAAVNDLSRQTSALKSLKYHQMTRAGGNHERYTP